ncbi:hypothetical protein ABQF26_02300 [Mycolicibacterium elephantis]
MKPYYVRVSPTVVEAWSGYRIQFDGMERHHWQKNLKAELKDALVRIALPHKSFAGYYDTTNPAVSDVENSLFTNMTGSLPQGIKLLRFERGLNKPPEPPTPIDLLDGHLHYYRYTPGGLWTAWNADKVVARWDRVPRRLPHDGSAGPVWFAIRHGRADGRVSITGQELRLNENFGLRLVVHATRQGPRNAISISENLVDGTLSAFHADRFSETLFPALLRRFARSPAEEVRRALDHSADPIFPTLAIRPFGKTVQFNPADERCIVGEVEIRQDSHGSWPELSGEIFTVRRQ